MTPSRNVLAHLCTVALLVVSLAGIATVQSGPARATLPVGSPTGHLDKLELAPGGLHASGWARDPNAISTRVYFYSDGSLVARAAARYPLAGVGYYGFDVTYRRPAGTHNICAIAINLGAGANRSLGCKTITFGVNPRGQLNSVVQVPYGVRVTGWALDPDVTTPIGVDVHADGRRIAYKIAGSPRADVARAYPAYGGSHGFDLTASLAAGRHTVCVAASNTGAGRIQSLGCKSITLNFEPRGSINVLRQEPGGQFSVTGWAIDPDTADPIQVHVYLDGTLVRSVRADLSRPDVARTYPAAGAKHGYTATATALAGTHHVCVSGLNVIAGTIRNPVLACRDIKLDFAPFGAFEGASRSGTATAITVRGWAADPDSSLPITVRVSVDGTAVATLSADRSRPDLTLTRHIAALHGFLTTVPANDREHRVCVTAVNVGAGTVNTLLGCRIVNAVHPVPPAAPGVTAHAGYGSATITWIPGSDGGAPPSRFTVRASNGKHAVTSGASRRAVITGLVAGRHYTFTVTATNVAGASPFGRSNEITTPKGPPPQTTPAPIATSRYVRNINGSSSDITKMRAEGAADAAHNPAGHRYLVLLDVGGQGSYGGKWGVVLSATSRFVSNAGLVKAVNAYVDGYASQQRLGAPATIAIGANNDMTVNASTGAVWAHQVVNPVATHAAGRPGLSIAGANDIEPGFRADAAHTRAWLSGYLGATSRQFVFNGSADGCTWNAVRGRCNNGWTAADMYWLSGGAAPTRIVSLPQIYNHTMAQQWKYISLTGVVNKHPRVKFGGPLTEYTACQQAGSCGSMSGHTAWLTLWGAIRSDARTSQGSLPYSTDLRIN